MSARSYLYVPGDQAGKLQHALGSGADAIIADLEDAVASSAKANARRTVADWLATRLDGDHPELWVRVNASARLLADDVHAAVGPAVTGICLPKTHTPEQVRGLGELLGAAEQRAGLAEGSIRIMPLLESAAGILSAPAIAQEPRVWQLGLGELDLCAEVGIQPSADERELLSIRVQVVLASAAAGLQPPVGPVSTDFRDLDALRQSTDTLRRVGFGSRWAVHPAQVAVINQAFTPTPEQVEAARRLVERYDGALDRALVFASTRMAVWWMKPSSARHVGPWHGLASWPRSLVSVEDEWPVAHHRKNFLYILKAGPAGGRLRRPSSAGSAYTGGVTALREHHRVKIDEGRGRMAPERRIHVIAGGIAGFVLGFFANQLSNEMPYLPGSALLLAVALLAGSHLLQTRNHQQASLRNAQFLSNGPLIIIASLLYRLAGLIPVCFVTGILIAYLVTLAVPGSTLQIPTFLGTYFSFSWYELVATICAMVVLWVGSRFLRDGVLRTYGSVALGAGLAVGVLLRRPQEIKPVPTLILWSSLMVLIEWAVAQGFSSMRRLGRALAAEVSQPRW